MNTAISPNGQAFNELDYIMTPANIYTNNVQIINKANVRSNHRIVRAMVQLNTRLVGIRLVKSNVQLADMDKHKNNIDDYNLDLATHFSMLNTEEMGLENFNF